MFFKNFYAYLIFAIFLATINNAYAFISKGQTPENIKKMVDYYESGSYFLDINSKMEKAREYLDIQMNTRKMAKLAIVLDVDETALSNYHNLKRMYFTGNAQAHASAYLLADSPPLESVLSIYEHALNHNVAVFFITSRPYTPEINAATTMNLKRAGYHTWEEIYMMPLDDDNVSVSEYKTKARQDIVNKGYDIILNIGDQNDDLVGGFSEAQVQLPNPFYSRN